MIRKPCLIVVEGPSHAGRTAVAERLATLGETDGSAVLRVVAPDTSNQFADGLVALQRATGTQAAFSPAVVATIRAALWRHLLIEHVRPALRAGDTVIVDGYWWSAEVVASLQRSRRAYLQHVARLETSSWENLRPDIVFFVTPQIDDPELRAIGGECLANYNQVVRRESAAVLVRTVFRDCHADTLLAALSAISSVPDEEVDQLALFTESESVAKATLPAPPVSEPVPSLMSPVIVSRISLPRPSPVYDTYWRFAVHRQEIFVKRLRGEPPPWTADRILAQHKFTNVYRASDRVSQYLIGRVIYRDERDIEDLVFRILLFKFFNKIETWELLEEQIGNLSWRTYSFARYDKILTAALSQGIRIYSAAYIMPSAGAFGYERKHQNHLRLLERMMHERLPQKIKSAGTFQDVFLLLKSYPGIGNFLAYQFAIDINYSPIIDFSESAFVVPGPGARDGIKKCFPDIGSLSEAEVIECVTERQEDEFERLGLRFERLGHRRLQFIDCQNLFCEVDKYARLKHPEIKGISGRTRIKQVYRMNGRPVPYFYPPKWGINAAVETMTGRVPTVVGPPPRPLPFAEEQLGFPLGRIEVENDEIL